MMSKTELCRLGCSNSDKSISEYTAANHWEPCIQEAFWNAPLDDPDYNKCKWDHHRIYCESTDQYSHHASARIAENCVINSNAKGIG